MFTDSMFRLYHTLFTEHSALYGEQTAILLQVGGFFELYDIENITAGITSCNVLEIAKLCNFTLSRHTFKNERSEECITLFGGFPQDSLPRYERLLVAAGWTVVVVKQTAKKVSLLGKESGFDREVDHISSPGCYINEEDEGGGGGDSECRQLVGCIVEAVSPQKYYWSIAALNLSTGSVSFAEGGSADRLHQFLCVHPPSEFVIWSDGSEITVDLTEALQTLCSATHLKCLGPESAAVDEDILARFWNIKVLAGWISRHPASRRSVAALMGFAADHVPSALRALAGAPVLWIPDGELRLGNAALEQLGLISLNGSRGSRGSKGKGSLFDLMNRCRSSAGSRLLRERLLRPIVDVADLNGRLDRIEATKTRDPKQLERALRSLCDFSTCWRRIQLGTATLKTVAALGISLEAATALGAPDAPAFNEWFGKHWTLVTENAGVRLESGPPISELPWPPGVYPDADALFAEGIRLRNAAQALCDSWSQLVSDGLKGKGRGGGGVRKKKGYEKESEKEKGSEKENERLYLDDAEGGGFRVTGTKRRVAAAIVGLRDTGDTTATEKVYKSSSLLENEQLKALSSLHEEWMKRWIPVWTATWKRSLEDLLTAGNSVIHPIEAWCADLDVSWTIAEIAKESHWVRPVFIENDALPSSVEAVGLRHPVIERLIKVPYVSHSLSLGLSLDTTMGILLYGMNASGKSSLMKALGLAVLLAQAGCPVPATSFKLIPFTSLFTRILGNDNLWAGLSSFAVEMTEFREILQLADERSLVLGDELCSGTESLSATALVAAGIETLAARHTCFLFATHLHELADLLPSEVRAMHLKVEYDAGADRLIYDRGLSEGAGSALYGLEVCRALGLPPAYLERAMTLRKQLAGWQVPRRSRYAAEAVVSTCEVCGSSRDLEMHHIVPQVAGGGHSAGNLVCLCGACHDAHHGGRLIVDGWEEESVASSGRSLKWHHLGNENENEIKEESATALDAWIREQLFFKISIATIQRMAKQIFGVTLSSQKIRSFSS